MNILPCLKTKTFEPEVEAHYRDWYLRGSLSFIRAAIIFYIVFFALVGLLNPFILTETSHFATVIRFGFLIPVLLIVFLLTFRRVFLAASGNLLILMIMLTTTGIILMITSAPDNPVHYGELIFVFVTAFLFLLLKLEVISVLIWSLTAIFVGLMAFSNLVSTGKVLLIGLFIVAANIIAMTGGFLIQRQSRKVYFLIHGNKRFCTPRDLDIFSSAVKETATTENIDYLVLAVPQTDQCPLMVFEVDMNLNVIYANRQALEKTGLFENDIKRGLRFSGLFLPREGDSVSEFFMGKHAGDCPSNQSFTLRGVCDKSYNVILFPTEILKAESVIGWRVTLLDISAQVKAEEELRDVSEKYKVLNDIISDGVFLVAGNTLKYANNRLAQMLEYELDELLSSSFDLNKLLTDESIQTIKNLAGTKLVGRGSSHKTVLYAITKSGMKIEMEVVFLVLSDSPAWQLFGVARDISDTMIALKWKEESLQTSRTTAFKLDFLGRINHNIRTQVTSILGILEVMSLALRDEKQGEYVKILESSTDKLIGDINQLLAFTDKESGINGVKPAIQTDMKVFTTRPVKRPSEPVKPLRILVVEDKQINQMVIQLILASLGHKVSVAGNGVQALTIFRPGEFDLILMDIKMPVMDGIAATSELRKKYTGLPPIVGLSASPGYMSGQEYLEMGFDYYIMKPVRREDFVRLIGILGV